MTPSADIIRQLLLDLDLVEETGTWRAFVSFLPDQPDEAVCVYDTAGTKDGRLMGTGLVIEHPGIQILVRGRSYPDTRDKAEAIALALDAQERVLVTLESNQSFRIQNITRPGPVIPLGMGDDDRSRFHFSVNALLTLQEES